MRPLSTEELHSMRGGGVVVIGEPYPGDDGGDPPIDPDDYNPESGGGGEGGQGDPFEGYTKKDISFSASSDDVLVVAKRISDKIKTTDDVLPYDKSWINAEYAATIVQDSTGYSVLADTIRTYGHLSRSGAPWTGALESGEKIKGLLHNHADEAGNDNHDLSNRYPNSGDFINLQAAKDADPDKFVADPSLFIIDAEGDLREFHLSDADVINALSASQRQDGVNLPQSII